MSDGPRSRTLSPSTSRPSAGRTARLSLLRSGTRLRSVGGVTTTEMTVIAGLVVAAIIAVMAIFRAEMLVAMNNLSQCIQGAASGNFGACTAGAQQAAAPANPNAIPGMRNTGVAGGLVMGGGTGPNAGRGPGGAAGPGGAGGVGGSGRGLDGRGGPSSGRPGVGGSTGPGIAGGMAGAGVAGGVGRGMAAVPPPADPKALAEARAQLNRYNRRRNTGKPDDPSWQEKGVRLWNATSLFSANRNLVSSQDELNEMAGRADNKANQWAQIAEQKLNAGDLQGFQDAIRKSRQYGNSANRMRGDSASIMADAADQAMTEATHIRQISFETASAIGNPTGFVAGKVTGYVVSTAADQILPDGRIKQVVVAVSSAAAAAYAGGMTPQAWQSLGASGSTTILGQAVTAETASFAVGIADQITSATTTYSTQGGEEAAWEIATALITHKVMNTKVNGLGDADGAKPGTGRSLNDYLAQAPSATAIRETLENNAVPLGQLEVSAANLRTIAENQYNRATGNNKSDPLTYKPLDADPAYVKTMAETPDPVLTKAELDAAASMGQTPEMAIAKAKHAQVTGGTFFDRATQLEATQLIQNGKAVGKGTEQHQKSAGDASPFLPMDTRESKLGARAAEATTPAARSEVASDMRANRRAIAEAIEKGTVRPGPPPPGDTRIKGPIAYEPKSNLPLVGDVDPVTNNLSRPTDPVRDGGVRGLGTYQELQDVSNTKSTLRPHNLDTTANHGHGGRNPGKEPLPERVVRYTPDGKVTVIEGQVNVLNAIREAGCPEHPSWAAQAQTAMQSNPGGPQLIAPPPNPPTPHNQRPTVQQAALANNRNTIRTNYVVRTQLGTMNTQHKDDKSDPRMLRSPLGRRWEPEPTDVPRITLVSYRRPDSRTGLSHVPLPWSGSHLGLGPQSEMPGQAGRTAPPSPETKPPDKRVEADFAVNRRWGMEINKALDQYGETWEDRQIIQHLKAYQRIRALAFDELQTVQHLDTFVRWAFGLLRGTPQPLPTSNQSSLFERIDAQAAPAWRGDLDAWLERGLHYGLVQHYAEQAMALAKREPYESFAIQADIARAFVAAAGEAAVRKAYFLGDTWGLYRAIGSRLGGPAVEAPARGFVFVQQLNQAAMTEDLAKARELLNRLPAASVNPARFPGAALFARPRWS